MKLLITSNGISNPDLEAALLKLTDGKTDLKVSIIPTAGDPIEWKKFSDEDDRHFPVLKEVPKYETNPDETNQYKEWKDRGFRDVGFVSLRDYPWIVKEKLENSDLIGIPGGDVDYLLEWSKKADIKDYWKNIINDGTIVVTSSAGGGLLGTNIGFNYWKPNTYFDTVGYGVIDFDVVVHQKEDDNWKNHDALVKRKKYMNENYPGGWDRKMYLLKDGQGILVNSDSVEHVGPGEHRAI